MRRGEGLQQGRNGCGMGSHRGTWSMSAGFVAVEDLRVRDGDDVESGLVCWIEAVVGRSIACP